MGFNKNSKDLKGVLGLINVAVGVVLFAGCVVGGVKCILNKKKQKDTDDCIENTSDDVFEEDGDALLGDEEPEYTPLFQKYKDDSENVEVIDFN